MADIMQDESLTTDQLALLREIAETFSVMDSPADLAILFEVTRFKAETEIY